MNYIGNGKRKKERNGKLKGFTKSWTKKSTTFAEKQKENAKRQ